MDHRRQEQRGIRGAPGDHDIGARCQRLRDRLGAEIGIGRQQPVAELLDGAVEFHDREIAVLAGVEHVVADHGGDLQRGKPERLRDLGGPARGSDRIGRAHIGDDLDALAGANRQHRAHPLIQQRIVTAIGILHARLLRQRHRALAQTFEYQILQVAFFGELNRRLDAIAGIAGAGPYSNGSHTVLVVIASSLRKPSAGVRWHTSYSRRRHCAPAGIGPCNLVAGPLTPDSQLSHQDRNKRATRPDPRRK